MHYVTKCMNIVFVYPIKMRTDLWQNLRDLFKDIYREMERGFKINNLNECLENRGTNIYFSVLNLNV